MDGIQLNLLIDGSHEQLHVITLYIADITGECSLSDGWYSILGCKVVFSSFSSVNQSAYSTPDWLMNIQSEFCWVVCKHYWEFPVNERIIPMLICCNCRVLLVDIANLGLWYEKFEKNRQIFLSRWVVPSLRWEENFECTTFRWFINDCVSIKHALWITYNLPFGVPLFWISRP